MALVKKQGMGMRGSRIQIGAMLAAALSWTLPAAVAAPGKVDLEPYLRQDQYERVKISPDGAYYAVTMPMEDRTVLAAVRRADSVPTAKIMGNADSVVDDFWWANNERLVVSMAERYGSRDTPSVRGELHAVNADGKNIKLLASPYGVDTNPGFGTTYRSGFEQAVYMVDTVPDDPNSVLVYSVQVNSGEPYTRLEKLNIYTRKRTPLANAPVRRARFHADARGEVRFAYGADADNVSRLYYRERGGEKWRLVNSEDVSGHREYPLGFTADGRHGLPAGRAQRGSGCDRGSEPGHRRVPRGAARCGRRSVPDPV